MAETTRALLMRSLLGRYQELRERLTRRLGSPDLAGDALNQTWITLRTRKNFAPVKDPFAYVYRAALNTASNLRLANNRRLEQLDIDDALGIADDAPGPAVIAEDRAEVAAMQAALAQLSERQQIIFHENFLGRATIPELAERFGVGVRTIQLELQMAVDHCAHRMAQRNRFVSGGSRLSTNRKGPSE